MKLSVALIQRPIASSLLALAIVLLGLLSYRALPVSPLPAFPPPSSTNELGSTSRPSR